MRAAKESIRPRSFSGSSHEVIGQVNLPDDSVSSCVTIPRIGGAACDTQMMNNLMNDHFFRNDEQASSGQHSI